MKVLYVYEGKLSKHGIDRVVREELCALASCGCAVDLVSRGDPRLAGVNFAGTRWTLANLVSWLPRTFYYPAQKRTIMRRGARLAAQRDYAKIVSWRERALLPFRIGADRGFDCYLNHDSMHWRDAVTASSETRWPSLTRAEMEEEHKLATKILLPSPNSEESFIRHGQPASKLAVIGRGVDTDKFTPGEINSAAVFRVIYCGKVCERKGIRQVVDAWKRANLPDAELLVVGRLEKGMEGFVRANSGGSIKWLGFHAEVAAIMRGCHAQILLSRREGMAKSLIEGASAGLATIATKDTGFPINEGENGFLVEREDGAQVAEILTLLCKNRGLCAQMGKSGRRTVLGGYSWQAFRSRFLDALGLSQGF